MRRFGDSKSVYIDSPTEHQQEMPKLAEEQKESSTTFVPTETTTVETSTTAKEPISTAIVHEKKDEQLERKIRVEDDDEQEDKKTNLTIGLAPSTSIPLSTTSESRSRAKKHWEFALNAVRSNVRVDQTAVPLLGVTGTVYHLEKLDPKHRRGKDLITKFNIWKESKASHNFFTWLDKEEGRTGSCLPRMIYRTTDSERKEIQAQWRDDKLFIKGEPCDTTEYKGKLPGYAAFSLSPDNELFLAQHKVESDVHASLQGGRRVAAAGMIQVKQGKITEISNFSGHYQPGLRNLLYAVKNIPENCFAADAKIIYQEQRFTGLTQKLRESKFSPMRSLGASLSRKPKKMVMSRSEFINFAEKQLEKKDNKFIHKRDKNDNRYESTLYESYLAKTIIENDKTWRPLVLKINKWIYDKISSNKTNKKMVSVLIFNLKKFTKNEVNETNFLEVAKYILLESRDLSPTLMFHGDFFEYIHPKIKDEKAYQQLPSYKKIRSDDLFFGANRGVVATTNLARKLEFNKHPFYQSDALGILPDEETPSTLSHYFEGQPGKHQPSKRFHKLNGERISYVAAQLNREIKKDSQTTFREEVIERDIPLVSGTSGTTSKIITPMIDILGLTREEVSEYLMVRGAVVAAYGHHSMYEVRVLARKLGFPTEYNHRFYHEQFITKAFRESKEYKDFLESYSQVVATHIPKPSESETQEHETYVRVKQAMEKKSAEKISSVSSASAPDFRAQIRSFDRSKLRKQTVYYSSLAAANRWVSSKRILKRLPRAHGFIAIGTPGSSDKKGFGQLYQSRQLRMQVPYIVSDKLISAVLASKKISKETKKIIQSLEGKRFQYAELFLRELFTITAQNKGLDIKDEKVKQKIILQAVNTRDDEVRELVVLNNRINKTPTVILPGITTGDKRDKEAFELGESDLAVMPHPHIDPMAVREVYQQQQLFTRYLEERAGIGESTHIEEKMKPTPENADQGSSLLVSYQRFPDKDNMFSSNCNKTAASLLQAAEDLTAAREKRPSRIIESASMFSVGSSQRMYLWNPLQISLKGTILQLIGKHTLDKSQLEKQSLADNKRNILIIISSLTYEKQKQALEDILNPATALGQIFYTKRTGTWRVPIIGRGYLKQAQEMLRHLIVVDSQIIPKVSEERRPLTAEERIAKAILILIKRDVLQTQWKKNGDDLKYFLEEISKSEQHKQSWQQTFIKISGIRSAEFVQLFKKGNYQKRYEKMIENNDVIDYLKLCLSTLKNKSGEDLIDIFKQDMSMIRESLGILDDNIWQQQTNYWAMEEEVRDEKPSSSLCGAISSGISLFSTKKTELPLPFQCSFQEAIQFRIMSLEQMSNTALKLASDEEPTFQFGV